MPQLTDPTRPTNGLPPELLNRWFSACTWKGRPWLRCCKTNQRYEQPSVGRVAWRQPESNSLLRGFEWREDETGVRYHQTVLISARTVGRTGRGSGAQDAVA